MNTRRTKVVALNTGTHRVPDELRRHQLADDDGNEYSTNLDRNRYGNDDQYLFTVIKFNLDALGLCPLICQVEIIDAKAPKSEECLVVKVPDEGCACHGGANAASAMRVVVGGSGGSRKSLDGSGKLERVSIGHTPGKESKGTPWRVPSTPMSPLKRVASAGDAGGMGVLLDALTQVGGMPPPSPLHLRSPTHNARRASFLSGGAMAAASPSMRPAAAAMSALVNSAPPSAERGAGAGVDVDAAAAAAAHMAQYFSAFGGALGTPAQSQLFAMHQHMQMNDAQQAHFEAKPTGVAKEDWERVVVLQHMFSQEEIAANLGIKDDYAGGSPKARAKGRRGTAAGRGSSVGAHTQLGRPQNSSQWTWTRTWTVWAFCGCSTPQDYQVIRDDWPRWRRASPPPPRRSALRRRSRRQ